MANTKISQLTALTNPTGNEEFVYALNNANGKVTLNTMKTFIGNGGTGATELNADANIWELTEGMYVTNYDLYYKTGSTLPFLTGAGVTSRQVIIVTENSGIRCFLHQCFYNVSGQNVTLVRVTEGWSASSDGDYEEIADRDWVRGLFNTHTDNNLSAIGTTLNQVVDNIEADDTLRVQTGTLVVGMTYTIVINSVKAGYTYSLTLGTGVTNPLSLALPTSSNKTCVITFLATDSSNAVITGCTIGN